MAGEDGRESMKNFINGLRTDTNGGIIWYAILTWGVLSILFFYFLNVDISEAPEFIYSQF